MTRAAPDARFGRGSRPPCHRRPDPASARKGPEALGHLEDVIVKAGGAVLRYGSLYGPGAIDDWAELVRKRMFPLVGGGWPGC